MLTWLIKNVLKKADVELHWKGTNKDEFSCIITWNGIQVLNRSFDVIKGA